MMVELTALDAIDSMDRTGLEKLWRQLLREPVPAGMSLLFLRRFVAFELQARHYGRLTQTHRRRLVQLAAGKQRRKHAVPATGGRLLREWNGITHIVEITEGGCRWQGRDYRSLSAVAREITGAHWSGPRFFGLDGKDGTHVRG